MGRDKAGHRKPASDETRSTNSSSYAPLPHHELVVYVTVEAAAVVFAIYSIYNDSIDKFPWIHPSLTEDGWSWLKRKKDIADLEWRFWHKTLWSLLPWYTGHFLLGKCMEQLFPKFRNMGYLLFSMGYLLHTFGWKVVLLFMAHSCTAFLAATFDNRAVVWATSLGLMCTINFDQSQTLMKCLMTSTGNENDYLYLVTVELVKVNLKYTSFCLEKVNNMSKSSQQTTLSDNILKTSTKSQTDISSRCYSAVMNRGRLPLSSSEPERSIRSCKRSEHYSLVDLFQYVFYFPLFFCAPVVTYNTFHTQINENPRLWNRRDIYDAFFVFLRIAFWSLFVEFSLHHLYFSAMMSSPHILRGASHWTLMGIGYLQGQFKMTKYFVFYGLTGQIARLDGIDVPGPPSCISYIYRYSQMWKLFDKGIYDFTKRYIYIPLGGSRAGIPRQLFGSFLSFMFFYNYHGLDLYLFIWCLLNFAELVIQTYASLLEKSPAVQRLEARWMKPPWVRRVHAVLAVPLFYISIFAIFYFFGGKQIGDIYIDRNFINVNASECLVIFSIAYCCIQVAMEIEVYKTATSHKTDN